MCLCFGTFSNALYANAKNRSVKKAKFGEALFCLIDPKHEEEDHGQSYYYNFMNRERELPNDMVLIELDMNVLQRRVEDFIEKYLNLKHTHIFHELMDLINSDSIIEQSVKDILLEQAKSACQENPPNLKLFLSQLFVYVIKYTVNKPNSEIKSIAKEDIGVENLIADEYNKDEKAPPSNPESGAKHNENTTNTDTAKSPESSNEQQGTSVPAQSTNADSSSAEKPIKIYNDGKISESVFKNIFNNSRIRSMLIRESRLQRLGQEYSNISKKAIKTILKNYVQQLVKDRTQNSNPTNTESKDIIIKNLLKVINKQSLLLIGKAGTGKSTALRWLFWHSRGIASYVRMSKLNVHTRAEILDEFQKVLVDNQIVFLDGLDELAVSFDAQTFIMELTDNFVERNIRFVISMRVDHYQGYNSLLKKYFSRKTLMRKNRLAVFET